MMQFLIKRVLILFCLCLFVLTACSKSETKLPPKETEPKTTLLIGLIPERNIFKQLERYEPLADYISERAGIDIKLKVLTRYGNIIDNFVYANMDGAFLGSFTYTLAHAKLGVVPIARPESSEGISTYYGMIFVRKDSGIKSAKDMKGKTFAFVDKATTAGYLLPLSYFINNGINDYKTYFKETYFAGTHENVIYDIFTKRADIGAAKNTVYEKLISVDSRLKRELVFLERSPDVPENGLAVRENLDDEIKIKLKRTLLNMHLESEGQQVLKKFGARRFKETNDDDYSGVYDYVKKIKLDLSSYDYMND